MNISKFESLKIYRKNWKKSSQDTRELSFWNSWLFFKQYFPWHFSLSKNYWEGPIQDEIPWMTFSAIDFLKKRLSKRDKVFEYGTGGSTFFFAKRVDEVISVESDPEWFQLVYKKINEKKINNINATCIPPENIGFNSLSDPSNYKCCYSSTGFLFDKYVNSISKYPENYFDWVVIDGRARPSCIKQAQSSLKPGKYLLLDNSDRTHYQLAINDLLKNWTRRTFEGPTPYLKWFTQTSVWQKPI